MKSWTRATGPTVICLSLSSIAACGHGQSSSSGTTATSASQDAQEPFWRQDTLSPPTAEATPVGNGQQEQNPAPASSANQDVGAKAFESELARLINAHRQSVGLAALVLLDAATLQARTHSEDMAGGTVPFGHDGFSERIDVIRSLFPARSWAENVAMSPCSAEFMVEIWLESSGHRSNIEGNFSHTGIGAARNASGSCFATQIFALK